MNDPYNLLGLPADEDLADERVRTQYLRLIREFPPEQQPAKFAAIRAAYEKIRTLHARAHHRLFDRGSKDTLEQIIEAAETGVTRPRPTFADLLVAATEAPRSP